MDALVIDVSASIGFLLKDEQDPLSLATLAAIRVDTPTFIPAIWPVEIANALLMSERRKRITQNEAAEILRLVQTLTLTLDDSTAAEATRNTYALARQHNLTIYDAAYLELAMRRSATLATNDRDLVKAAKAAGVAVLAT
jgi:predicted nucleic acid-binding protein